MWLTGFLAVLPSSAYEIAISGQVARCLFEPAKDFSSQERMFILLIGVYQVNMLDEEGRGWGFRLCLISGKFRVIVLPRIMEGGKCRRLMKLFNCILHVIFSSCYIVAMKS